MPILVNIYDGADTYYLSDRDRPLQGRQYIRGVGEMDEISMATPTHHGGLYAARAGRIGIIPQALMEIGLWPPNAGLGDRIEVQWIAPGDDDPANAETFFEGTAIDPSFEIGTWVYFDLQLPDQYTGTVAASTNLSGNLDTVLSGLLTPLTGITSLDATSMRSPTPVVSHTTTTEQQATDLASEIAASFCHMLDIRDGVAHLFAVEAAMQTIVLTDMLEYSAIAYHSRTRIKKSSGGGQEVYTGNAHGQEVSTNVYHSTPATILTDLAFINYVEGAKWPTLTIPYEGVRPLAGTQYQWIDRRWFDDQGVPQALTGWLANMMTSYNLMDNTVTVSGGGTWSAA